MEVQCPKLICNIQIRHTIHLPEDEHHFFVCSVLFWHEPGDSKDRATIARDFFVLIYT